MNKKITRDDVAKLAGVSPAVVSYVINQTKFVSEEKTQAVRRAIEELQYRPNLHARSLKTNKTMQIAFVCDNLRNNWLEIAEQKFFDRGYFVSHCYSRDGDEFIQTLIEGRFDGVFMLSNRYTAAQLNQIAGAGIPVVLAVIRYICFLIGDGNQDPVRNHALSLDSQIAVERGQCRCLYQFVKNGIFLNQEPGVRHLFVCDLFPEAETGAKEHGLSIKVL